MLITYQHKFSHKIQTLGFINKFVHEFGSLSTLKLCPNGDPYESPSHVSHAHEIMGIFGTPKFVYFFACDFCSFSTLGNDVICWESMARMVELREGKGKQIPLADMNFDTRNMGSYTPF